jgi:hypothetical protein
MFATLLAGGDVDQAHPAIVRAHQHGLAIQDENRCHRKPSQERSEKMNFWASRAA